MCSFSSVCFWTRGVRLCSLNMFSYCNKMWGWWRSEPCVFYVCSEQCVDGCSFPQLSALHSLNESMYSPILNVLGFLRWALNLLLPNTCYIRKLADLKALPYLTLVFLLNKGTYWDWDYTVIKKILTSEWAGEEIWLCNQLSAYEVICQQSYTSKIQLQAELLTMNLRAWHFKLRWPAPVGVTGWPASREFAWSEPTLQLSLLCWAQCEVLELSGEAQRWYEAWHQGQPAGGSPQLHLSLQWGLFWFVQGKRQTRKELRCSWLSALRALESDWKPAVSQGYASSSAARSQTKVGCWPKAISIAKSGECCWI